MLCEKRVVVSKMKGYRVDMIVTYTGQSSGRGIWVVPVERKRYTLVSCVQKKKYSNSYQRSNKPRYLHPQHSSHLRPMIQSNLSVLAWFAEHIYQLATSSNFHYPQPRYLGTPKRYSSRKKLSSPPKNLDVPSSGWHLPLRRVYNQLHGQNYNVSMQD